MEDTTREQLEKDSVWVYEFSYKDRYGVNPKITPYILGRIRELINLVEEYAASVIRVYLNTKKDWYLKTKHDLKFAVEDAERHMEFIKKNNMQPIDLNQITAYKRLP